MMACRRVGNDAIAVHIDDLSMRQLGINILDMDVDSAIGLHTRLTVA